MGKGNFIIILLLCLRGSPYMYKWYDHACVAQSSAIPNHVVFCANVKDDKARMYV